MNFICISIALILCINLNNTFLCHPGIKIRDNEANGHNLNWTLPNANSNFVSNLNYLLKTSAPRKIQTICHISEKMLVDLKSEIKETMKNVSTRKNIVTCTLNFDAPDDCDSLLSLLQCGFNHILEAFDNAKQNSVSQSEYDALKKAYYSLKETTNRFKDNAGRNEKHLLKKIDYLITMIDQLNQEKHEIFVQHTILLCAWKIEKGQIDDALIEYNKLEFRDIENIKELIDLLFINIYQNKNEVMKKLDEFMDRLPPFHKLVAHNNVLENIMSAENFQSIELDDLRNMTKIVIDNWKSQIQSISDKQIIEYSKIRLITFKDLKKKIFDGSTDKQKMLEFIANLPNPIHKIIGYEVVLEGLGFAKFALIIHLEKILSELPTNFGI